MGGTLGRAGGRSLDMQGSSIGRAWGQDGSKLAGFRKVRTAALWVVLPR